MQFIYLISASQELRIVGRTTTIHNYLVDSIISSFDIYELDLSNVEFQEEFDLNLVLGDEFNLKLHLIENELRSKSYKSHVISSHGEINKLQSYARLYKGYLDNNPENKVRLTFYNNVLNGFIKRGEKVYRVLPLDKWTKANNIDKFILFCEEKYLPEEIHLGEDAIADEMKTTVNGLKSIIYSEPVYNLSFAAEADYEWYQEYQGNSELTILSIINAADDLFESECNIKFSIENIDIYTTSNDPFTSDFSNGSALLNELSSHWNSAHSGIYANVICLFSDKSCPSCGYRGWGRRPGNVCAIRDGSYNYKVLAHEIGHNLGATHGDAYYGSPSSIMDSTIYLSAENFWLTNANKSNISNEINNRLVTYSYYEDNAICGNETFSISNIPTGFTVTWPKSNTLDFDGATTGSPVVIKPYSTSTQGDGWVEPTLTKGGQIIKFNKDEFWVGEPDPDDCDMIALDNYGSPIGMSGGPFYVCPNNYYTFYLSPVYNLPETHHRYGITGTDFFFDFDYTIVNEGFGWAYIYVNYINGNSNGLVYTDSGCGGYEEFKVASVNEDYCGYYLAFTPNPSSSETILSIESTSGDKAIGESAEWEMEVYSEAQTLKEKQTNLKGNNAKLQTAGWNEGIYVVRVKYKDEILTGKLVVKK